MGSDIIMLMQPLGIIGSASMQHLRRVLWGDAADHADRGVKFQVSPNAVYAGKEPVTCTQQPPTTNLTQRPSHGMEGLLNPCHTPPNIRRSNRLSNKIITT